MKHKTSVTLDAENIEFAKKLGLNLSQFTNEQLNQLRMAIEANPESLRRDLNPRPSAYKANAIDWIKYRAWLHEKHYAYRWEIALFSNAQKYSECLLKADLTSVRDLPLTNRPNVMKALSALAKFLGVRRDFFRLCENYDLQWHGKSTRDLFAERLEKEDSSKPLFKWIVDVKEARPQLCLFLDLMVSTGLRLVEGVNCWNILIEHGLENYYNPVRSGLEHWKYKEVFLRPKKNAFFSFAHENLVKEIPDERAFHNPDYVLHLLQRSGLKTRFSDLRELHATFMLKWLKPEEVDFLHGRVSGSVFMRNYYNPSLMDDLKERALTGIDAILEKTKL